MDLPAMAFQGSSWKGVRAMNQIDNLQDIPAYPFPGIDPYSYAEHKIFFARDDELRSLIRLVVMYRGTLLYSASGTGKSSLLNAGLIARAVGEGFSPEKIRVQHREGEEFVVGRIATKAGDHASYLPSIFDFDEHQDRLVLSIEDFLATVRVQSKGAYPLLILDQFEEWVTLFEAAGAGQAAKDAKTTQDGIRDAIASILNDNELRVKILIALREDYLASLTPLFRLCPTLPDRYLWLTHLKSEQVLQAICGPFEKYPARYRPSFTPELVKEITAQFRERSAGEQIHLTEVQIVCRCLWEQSGDSKDPLALFKDLRGVQGILEKYLESSLQSLPAQQQKPAVALLSRMVTPAGTRNVISKDDILSRVEMEEDISRDLLTKALDNLEQNTGLIRRERRREVHYYEIVSEFLVGWIRKKSLERRQQLEKEKFLDDIRKKEQQEKARRRQRFAKRLSIAAFSLVVLIAIVAWAEYVRAKRHAMISFARELSATALREMDVDLDRSLLLSLHATSLSLSAENAVIPEVQEALRRAVSAHRENVRLVGHKAAVQDIALSADGSLAVTAGLDSTVRIWDVASGQQMTRLTEPGSAVLAVSLSPVQELVAAACADGSVHLWDLPKRPRAPLLGHTAEVYGLAFSPSGKRLATSGSDGLAIIWEVSTGNPVKKFRLPARITAVAFSPDEKYLGTASEGFSAVWEIETGVCSDTLRNDLEDYSIAFSSDGRLVATAGRDVFVKIWERPKKLLQRLRGHTNTIKKIAFSGNGRRLGSASFDGTLRVWEREEDGIAFNELVTISSGQAGAQWGLSFDYSGSLLASASDDGTARIWSTSLGKELWTLERKGVKINKLSYNREGTELAIASGDEWSGLAEIINARKGETGGSFYHPSAVNGVAFSPDGTRLATASDDGRLRIWHLSSPEMDPKILEGHEGTDVAVAFSKDGTRLVSVGSDSVARVWNPDSGEMTALFRHDDAVHDASFSPDGVRLAVACEDGKVWLWDVPSQEFLRTLGNHANRVTSVAFSPLDGKRLLTTSATTAKVWDAESGNELLTLIGHTDVLLSGTFSKDGKRIVTSGFDRSVRVWDAESGRELLKLGNHRDWVTSVDFSPDGNHLASCSSDHTVRTYTLDPKELVRIAQERVSRTFTPQECTLYLRQKALPVYAQALEQMVKGKELARKGEIRDAVVALSRAKELDPTLDINPETLTKQIAIGTLVTQGTWLARQDSILRAIEKFRKAEELDSSAISAENWNSLCWYGSLSNAAKDVRFACDRAVALAPTNGAIKDSRGLARALTGDPQGAIEDLRSYLRWDYSEERKARREEWIRRLLRDPRRFSLSKKEIQELRNE